MSRFLGKIRSNSRKVLQGIFQTAIHPEKVQAPAVGAVNLGDLGRLTPISTDWGFKRGGAIDRIYIEKFLKENAADIKGCALEIMNNNYLKQFGDKKVMRYDILDIDPHNPKATIIADLAKADHLPLETYDCIVLTQTLHLIYDLRAAMRHLHRILKPGGVLLVSVPGISHFPYKTAPRYWAFTNFSLETLLMEYFRKDKIRIETHGNVLTAASFLYGMGAADIKQEAFEYHDPNYQLIITARAVK